MKIYEKTREELLLEIEVLRNQLDSMGKALRAIRRGKADIPLPPVSGHEEKESFTLEQLNGDVARLDRESRDLVEALHERQDIKAEPHRHNEGLSTARDVACKRQDRYAELFENAPDCYIVTDSRGIMKEINRAAGSLLGIRQDLAVDKPFIIFVAEEDRQELHYQIEQLSYKGGIQDWEIRLKPYGGVPFHAGINVVSVRSAAVCGTTLRWLIRDISKRKQAEEALQESERRLRILSSKLIHAQEEERKRISRELHDSIGSALGAVKFRLESILAEMTKSDVGYEPIKDLIPMVQNTMEETRRIMMDLRPSMLDDLGVVATLGWFCRQFQTVYSSICVESAIEINESDIPGHLKVVIFRIAQEAFHNAAKYSHADLIRLSLEKSKNSVSLLIEDNGQGFDAQSALCSKSDSKGLGLTSMQERTELSHGTFTIKSTIGRGTKILAVWSV